MAFHLLAFAESVASGEQAIKPVQDDVFSVKDTIYIVSSTELSIFAAFAMSANLRRAKLSYPTIRQIDNPYVRPIVVGSSVPTDPNLARWLSNPLVVPPGEPLDFEVDHNSGSNELVQGALWVARQLEPAPSGPVVTVKGNGSGAVTANTWTPVDVTFGGSGIGPGRYAVVGCECVSATPFLFRMRFDDQGYRPGGLSQASAGDRTADYFSVPGTLGVWGYFGYQVLPRFEVLSSGTPSAHDFYMQIVKVG